MRHNPAILLVATALLVACGSSDKHANASFRTPSASMSYEEAKVLADADDAKLSGDALFALRHAHGSVMGAALRRCERPVMDLSGFSVALAVSPNGSITHVWRKGDTPLARCVQSELSRSEFAGKWSAPFYTSIVLTRNEP